MRCVSTTVGEPILEPMANSSHPPQLCGDLLIHLHWIYPSPSNSGKYSFSSGMSCHPGDDVHPWVEGVNPTHTHQQIVHENSTELSRVAKENSPLGWLNHIGV